MTESTRDVLVRAGVELCEETGSIEVGLREIARRAGVSHGAPRRYFPTHRSLLAAVARVGLADLDAALIDAHDLIGIAEAYVRFAVDRPTLFGLIFRHDLLAHAGEDLRSVSRPMFERFAARCGDRDPVVVWTAVHGVAVLASSGALGLITGDVHVRRLLAEHVAVPRGAAAPRSPNPAVPER